METNKILEQDNVHIYAYLHEKAHLFKKTRVLVTGSDGFLGKTIVSFLNFLNSTKFGPEEQVEVIAIDYKDYDICNSLEACIPEGPLHYIINFA